MIPNIIASDIIGMEEVFMNKKVKIALEISLFVLIFGGIMVLASFFDMNISHILTKGAVSQYLLHYSLQL